MNFRQKISKLQDSQIIKLANDYFKTIYLNNSISADETNNFLFIYLEYIMRINSISSTDYDIDIHLVKKLHYKKMEAYLRYIEKMNKFDVFFARDDLKMNCHNNLIYNLAFKKQTQASRELQNDLALHYFIYKLTVSGHEFQHIVQVILNKQLYEDYKLANAQVFEDLNQNATKENFAVLAKQAENTIEEIGFTHPMEIEANMMSFIYMNKLLNEIISTETDEAYKQFLFNFIKQVNQDKEDKILEYGEQNLTRRNLSAYIGLDYDLDVEIPIAKNKGGVII